MREKLIASQEDHNETIYHTLQIGTYTMNQLLQFVKNTVYDIIGFPIKNITIEAESQEYDACRFNLNTQKIISRTAKITSKKTGQFVTFWKRINNGPIEPFTETDTFDYYVINTSQGDNIGQFVFPKDVLIRKGIVSTKEKEGKRAFRVYPSWDQPISKQAAKTQQWQLSYFYLLIKPLDVEKVKKLYTSAQGAL